MRWLWDQTWSAECASTSRGHVVLHHHRHPLQGVSGRWALCIPTQWKHSRTFRNAPEWRMPRGLCHVTVVTVDRIKVELLCIDPWFNVTKEVTAQTLFIHLNFIFIWKRRHFLDERLKMSIMVEERLKMSIMTETFLTLHERFCRVTLLLHHEQNKQRGCFGGGTFKDH